MISTGNDIVDFRRINLQRTRQERFYSKFLSAAESGSISNYPGNPGFEHLVWLLWSVKESVFKFSKRDHPDLVFNPRKMDTRLTASPSAQYFLRRGEGEQEGNALKKEQCYACRIKTATGIYFSRSIVYRDMIHSVVSDAEHFDNIYWGVKYIHDPSPSCQSDSVRSFCLKKFKTIYPGANLLIEKSPVGYPVLTLNGTPSSIPISFSHHFQYVAYAFVCGHRAN